MTHTLNDPESARRQHQIQKLLEAINNYCPSVDEIEAMKNAKKQMIKNIQKKFALSKVNLTYQFPFRINDLSDSDNEDIESVPQICNLKTQNEEGKYTSKSKQKNRRPLQQKPSNKSETNLNSIKKVSNHSKEKDSHLLKNIEKAFKSGIKCQTPKVIKKQIILTHKKQPSKQNTKNHLNFEDQSEGSEIGISMNIKTKLKIKKPNNSLNEAKKHVHMRTENNINFQHSNQSSNTKTLYGKYREDQNDSGADLFQQARTQQKHVIQEEPSEESMFFNSRNNQNMDENTNFEYPKALFNVSDLKEKLRQTSKSKEKDFVKRHKRTATQGCAEIKIKLFSNSFKKNSYEKNQTLNKIPFPTSLFKKNGNTTSTNNIMNRTVSSLSQHSLKKGIKLCGKTEYNGERNLSKSLSKYQLSTAKQPLKHTISKLSKGTTQELAFQKDRKNMMSTHSFLTKGELSRGPELKLKNNQSKENNSQYKSEKENVEVNRASKINSIMTSLKEGYKVKNGSKPPNGIKTTVCR